MCVTPKAAMARFNLPGAGQYAVNIHGEAPKWGLEKS
jgi:hypothetical protein